MRIMVRDIISRLRDGGYGVVALAMRFKLGELEKLENITVFALDDQAIFTGGGHGYVSAVRYHIVQGHRLTRADLLRLGRGTVVATLAGEEQKLVVTHGAGSATDEIRVNSIPVKEPDAAMNSRVIVHGIYVPFPRLHLANLAASVAVASSASAAIPSPPVEKRARTTATLPPHSKPRLAAYSGRHGFRKTGQSAPTPGRHGAIYAAAAVGMLGLVGLAANQGRRERRSKEQQQRRAKILRRRVGKMKEKQNPMRGCSVCGTKETAWRSTICGLSFCCSCVVNGFLDTHVHIYRRRGCKFFCASMGCSLVLLVAPEMDPVDGEHFLTREEHNRDTITKTFVSYAQLQQRQAPKRLMVSYKKSGNTLLDVKKRSPVKKLHSFR